MAPEVTVRGADMDFTMSQRSCLIGHLLMAQEAVEEDKG
jgi:hypothetical protein